MKANELMIGDWIEPRQSMIPTVYCRIEGIYPDGTVHLDKAEITFNLDEIKPVFINREVLLKNGFEENFEGLNHLPVYKYKNVEQAQNVCLNLIRISYYEGVYDIQCGISSHIYDLKYVHELQHAFRLCGINKEIEL